MSLVPFFLLGLFLPTQLGLHFWPAWTYVNGLRIDYLAPTIYFTDFLLVLLLLLNFPLFFSFLKKHHHTTLFFLLLFLLHLFFSLIPLNTFVFGLRLLLLLNLAYITSRLSVKSFTLFLKLFTLSLCFVSFLAILQFLAQSSLGGPLYLLGERTFNLATPNIARFSFNHHLYLRPYSLFSHPNSLAGYLAVSFLLLLSFRRHFSKATLPFLYLTFFVSLLSLFLAYSHAVFFALFLVLLFHLLHLPPKPQFMFTLFLVLFFTILLLITPLFPNNESFYHRHLLANSAIHLFLQSPFTGVGLNNFIPALSSLSRTWDYQLLQPAHNLFLLLLAETGILFPILIFYLRRFSLPLILLPVFIAFLLTATFDHYWLTLPQNRLLLFFCIGLSFNQNLFRNTFTR